MTDWYNIKNAIKRFDVNIDKMKDCLHSAEFLVEAQERFEDIRMGIEPYEDDYVERSPNSDEYYVYQAYESLLAAQCSDDFDENSDDLITFVNAVSSMSRKKRSAV